MTPKFHAWIGIQKNENISPQKNLYIETESKLIVPRPGRVKENKE